MTVYIRRWVTFIIALIFVICICIPAKMVTGATNGRGEIQSIDYTVRPDAIQGELVCELISMPQIPSGYFAYHSYRMFGSYDGKTYTFRTRGFVTSSDLGRVNLPFLCTLSPAYSSYKIEYGLTASNDGAWGDEDDIFYKLAETTISLKKATFELNENTTNKTNRVVSIPMFWYDNDFTQDSTEYNHNIAKLSIALSAAAYGSTNQNISQAFLSLGFAPETIESFNYDQSSTPDEDKVAFTFACRPTNIGGINYNIIAIAVRGTFQNEWYSNFKIGNSTEHAGFSIAASEIITKLSSYILSHDYFGKPNKLLIVGHSRGAAVANIVAERLTNGGHVALKKDIFAYTFATPNTVVKPSTSNKNIINIINPEDFVPYSPPPTPDSWGYGRYGITYELPSKQSSILYNAMNVRFKRLTGRNFIPFDGRQRTTEFAEKIGWFTHDPSGYYEKQLSINFPFTTYHYFLSLVAVLATGARLDKLGLFLDLNLMALSAGAYQAIVMSEYFLVNSNINHKIDFAHAPETYYAWMYCTDGKDPLLAEHKFTKLDVHCPVDIEVYDSSDELVGRVQDNVVDESIQNSIQINVINDVKELYLPGDEQYRVEMRGTGEGTMDVVVSQHSEASGELERYIFNDIPLYDGKTMDATVTSLNEETPPTAQDYAVRVMNEEVVTETILPDEELSGNELNNIEIVATTSAGGIATGGKLYTKGDYVKVEAIASLGYAFAGWYENNTLIANADATYYFTAESSRSLEARFVDTTVYEVRFDTLDGLGIETVSVNTNSKIPMPAIPLRSGYDFAGWYREEECVNAWSFEVDLVDQNLTLYAKWMPQASDEPMVEQSQEEPKQVPQVVLVTTIGTNINLRADSKPTSKIVGKIGNGQILEFLTYRNGFVQILYNGQKVWISAEFLQFDYDTPKQGLAPSTAVVYQNAAGNAKKLGRIMAYNEFKILGHYGKWLVIEYQGQRAYIPIKNALVLDFKQNMQGLLRNKAALYDSWGAAGKKVVTLNANAKLRLIGLLGSWYKVEYNGQTLFVPVKYLKTVQSN